MVCLKVVQMLFSNPSNKVFSNPFDITLGDCLRYERNLPKLKVVEGILCCQQSLFSETKLLIHIVFLRLRYQELAL